MIARLFGFFFNIKRLAYFYGIVFVYQTFFGFFPLILFYHIRGALEWISVFIPVEIFYAVLSIWLGITILKSIKKIFYS